MITLKMADQKESDLFHHDPLRRDIFWLVKCEYSQVNFK